MSDNKEKLTKRALALREETREQLREKIANGKVVADITDIEFQLLALAAEEAPNNGRVGALKAALDSKWKRISYVLPSLKALELSGSGDDGEIVLKWLGS